MSTQQYHKLLILSVFVHRVTYNNCTGELIKDCACIQLYKSVCGCDGKTYGNACVAGCAGIKEWKEGECPPK